MIRRFAGGLELLISLLESSDVRVLSCVCATVAEVAKNEDNLAIITDLDVVTYLAKLVSMVSISRKLRTIIIYEKYSSYVLS